MQFCSRYRDIPFDPFYLCHLYSLTICHVITSKPLISPSLDIIEFRFYFFLSENGVVGLYSFQSAQSQKTIYLFI
jgi:hypothetical protein